jgi:Fe2+ transport system protein FeoA
MMKTDRVSSAGQVAPAVRFLAGLCERQEAVIAGNPDRKSREMGLAPGAHVRVLRNRRHDHALVVALGDARFLVSRPIAEHLTVAMGD